MSAPEPANNRRAGAEATGAGVFIGTLISFFIAQLPETNVYKVLLVTLTPAISDAIAYTYAQIRNRMVEGSEDQYISATALNDKKVLLDKLNDPTLSDEEKVSVVQAIAEINKLEIEAAVVRIRKAQEMIDRRKAARK